MNIKYLLVLLAACAMNAGAQAQILVSYTFAGGSPAPTSTVANVTAGNAAWAGLSGASFSASSGNAFAPANVTAASFDASDYLSFTITAQAGYFLNLETLNFRLGGQTSALPYTFNASVRSSLDSFATNILINPGATPTVSGSNTVAGTSEFTSFSADLTGASYNNVSTITFRLYPWDSKNDSNTWVRFDDLEVNGAVTAIPEPSSTALLACVGLLMVTRKVRKRNLND